MSRYSAAHLRDIEVVDDGRAPLRPVRHHFGITSFGINAWTAEKAGDRIINEHDEADVEDQQEELYFVQSGRARFELDGENVDAPAGTFVHVLPAVTRTAFAEEPGTTIVAIGATPGKPFEPVGWEIWAQLRPLFEAGKYDEVAEQSRELVAENPGYPILYYNLACAESLAGRKPDALEHLRLAIEGSEQLRSYASNDSDFDAIRDEPAFEELVRSPQ
jgi:mannose-6-phosphate isomerase-like protein (cupin superfamily)